MAWGKLYEVRDGARALFEPLSTKADWYEALGQLNIGSESVPECDVEESISGLGNELELQPYPWNKLFIGELHAEFDEFDDPNVSFLGKSLVKDIAQILNTTDETFFDQIATDHPPNPYTWLFRLLRTFYNDAASRDSGVVCLWET